MQSAWPAEGPSGLVTRTVESIATITMIGIIPNENSNPITPTHRLMARTRRTRSIFIFGKPPTKPNHLTLPPVLWRQCFYLSHWSLLVTALTADGLARALTKRTEERLGVLFELSVGEHNLISVKSRPVSNRTILLQWSQYIYQYIGTTTMEDTTIMDKGTLIPASTIISVTESIAWKITEVEGSVLYHQLDNNCQEFIVSLVGRISVDAECPRTLKSYFKTIAKQAGFPDLETDSESGSTSPDTRSLSLFSAMSSTHRLTSRRDQQQARYPISDFKLT